MKAATTAALVLALACAGGQETPPDRAETETPGGAAAPDTSRGSSAPAPHPDTAARAEPSTPAGGPDEWTVRDTRVARPDARVATLRRVETARHDDYDRIVLDFGEDDVPSWRVSYIDRPVRQCGSGNTVRLPGDAWLEVHVEPARAHTDEGAPTVEDRHRSPGLPAVLELVLTCDFEAHVTWVAAVPAPGRYRAFVLRAPHRLVVDVRHPRR